jgi:hypothetical protein
MAITRPPLTYTTFSFLLCNLILEKLLFVASGVVVVIIATGGS